MNRNVEKQKGSSRTVNLELFLEGALERTECVLREGRANYTSPSVTGTDHAER